MYQNHNFNFAGGEILTKMGATWFVSYSYYRYIDDNHDNWKKINTASYRIGWWNSSHKYHKFWLEQIAYMSNDKLNTNHLGLDGNKTKFMAKQLLQVL